MMPFQSAELDDCIGLFVRANVPAVVEFFRAFELSGAQAIKLHQYVGLDEYFVAMLAKRPVGFGMLRGWDEGYAIPSLGLFVEPGSQGKGVGRAIVRHGASRSRLRGASRLRLTVDSVNQDAIGLYQTCGFQSDSLQSSDAIEVMYLDVKASDQLIGETK